MFYKQRQALPGKHTGLNKQIRSTDSGRKRRESRTKKKKEKRKKGKFCRNDRITEENDKKMFNINATVRNYLNEVSPQNFSVNSEGTGFLVPKVLKIFIRSFYLNSK